MTAHLGLVTSKKLTEEDRPVVERIVERLEDGEVKERPRTMLHFAAGKALDDLGNYAAAIEHFDAANRIRRKLAPFDRSEFARGRNAAPAQTWRSGAGAEHRLIA